MIDQTVVERVELNDRGDVALVRVERDGISVVAEVPIDLEEEHVDETLNQISDSMNEHVPQFGGGGGS